jgi:hypothetical protein
MHQPTAARPHDVGSPTRPDHAVSAVVMGSKSNRDPVLVAAAWVAGIAAAVASWSALYGLALRCGWSHLTAPLFPLTVDAYAVAALRIWLGGRTADMAARKRARRSAVLAIVASMGGNAALHATTAGVFSITWPVVVAVSAIPPVTLGLVSHLFTLRGEHDGQADDDDTPTSLPEVPPSGVLAGLPKAEAIRIALAHNSGAVLDAQRWLAERGVTADRAYMHDVKRGVSGKRRRNRQAPETAPEAAA